MHFFPLLQQHFDSFKYFCKRQDEQWPRLADDSLDEAPIDDVPDVSHHANSTGCFSTGEYYERVFLDGMSYLVAIGSTVLECVFFFSKFFKCQSLFRNYYYQYKACLYLCLDAFLMVIADIAPKFQDLDNFFKNWGQFFTFALPLSGKLVTIMLTLFS